MFLNVWVENAQVILKRSGVSKNSGKEYFSLAILTDNSVDNVFCSPEVFHAVQKDKSYNFCFPLNTSNNNLRVYINGYEDIK